MFKHTIIQVLCSIHAAGHFLQFNVNSSLTVGTDKINYNLSVP